MTAAAMTAAVDGRLISGARELPRDDLLERAQRAARGFTELGVGAGDAVALVLRNDFPFFEASFATQQLGAYSVPVNWHSKTPEIGYILEDCGAKAVLAHADLLPQVAPAMPDGVPLLVVPTPPEIAASYGLAAEARRVPAGAQGWEQWRDSFAPLAGAPSGAISSMIYTSGTTGNPKGVRRQLDGSSAMALARLASDVFGIAPGKQMRTVVTGPLYHSAPNFFGLSAVRDGGLTILQPRFVEEELLALIERYRITHLHMVPTMFVRLLRLPEEVKRKYDLSSLQVVVHGAAPCPADVKRRMIEWWGPVIVEYYGATETGAVVLHNSEEALRKPGTVGRAVPGASIRIYDDDGKALGPGEVGEIYIWLEGFPDFTYHNNPQKRADCERDGLISVGDVGYVDDDGYLFLCDRKRDMVIMGGSNIYPIEIESVLLGMPGVLDCAVFGIPDDDLGEKLAAYIQPAAKGAIGADDVRAYLRERLANFKVPGLIEFVSELPREDSGKIMKRKLREPYWAAAGRSI
jgi:long-chain acyl-CoA synthetase